MRARFKRVFVAYSAKLKTTTLMKALDEQFVELDSEMSEHVAKANHYGNKWTEQMDKAGLVVKDRVIKTTGRQQAIQQQMQARGQGGGGLRLVYAELTIVMCLLSVTGLRTKSYRCLAQLPWH